MRTFESRDGFCSFHNRYSCSRALKPKVLRQLHVKKRAFLHYETKMSFPTGARGISTKCLMANATIWRYPSSNRASRHKLAFLLTDDGTTTPLMTIDIVSNMGKTYFSWALLRRSDCAQRVRYELVRHARPLQPIFRPGPMNDQLSRPPTSHRPRDQ
jgi:hypothetical protein